MTPLKSQLLDSIEKESQARTNLNSNKATSPQIFVVKDYKSCCQNCNTRQPLETSIDHFKKLNKQYIVVAYTRNPSKDNNWQEAKYCFHCAAWLLDISWSDLIKKCPEY